MKNVWKEEELVEVEENVKLTDLKDLVIYNDNYNTFDHVIDTLINICKHSTEQAEQCTYIIHFKGKCTVKTGPITLLTPMKEAILDRGIDARIH